jgi:hypothetical protein
MEHPVDPCQSKIATSPVLDADGGLPLSRGETVFVVALWLVCLAVLLVFCQIFIF